MCQLYRHYDADERLLYVGISLHAVYRLSQHRASPWFDQIADIRVEKHETRQAALEAEAEAIRTEGPIYNKARPSGVSQNAAKPYYDAGYAAGFAAGYAASEEEVSGALDKAEAEMEAWKLERASLAEAEPKYVPLDMEKIRRETEEAIASAEEAMAEREFLMSSKWVSPGWERTKRWRSTHPEQYREYMQAYMRKRRARVD
jgi:hypothetical protein